MKNKEDQFEDLVKQWPDLFQKAQITYLEIDDGWLPIVENICRMISSPVDNLRDRIHTLKEEPDIYSDLITQYENKLIDEIENLPIISQVKEKFGGLRFYIHNSTDRIDNYIDFAETMSTYTCEMCGKPGRIRPSGWVKTLCDDHEDERLSSLQKARHKMPE